MQSNKGKKKRSVKRSTTKKPKIKLDTNKVILLCVSIVFACVVLLLVTTKFSSRKEGSSVKSAPEVVIKQNDKSTENKTKPADNIKTERNSEPNSPPKISSNTAPVSPYKVTPAVPEKNDPPKSNTKPTEKPSNKGNTNNSSNTVAKRNTTPTGNTTPTTSTVPKDKPSTTSNVAPQNDFGFPFAKQNAKLVIIFDDGGQNLSQLEKCLSLPFPVTVAVLPQLPHSKEAASRVRATGNDVMLHQPMQAININVNPGPSAILPDMNFEQIRKTLLDNIAEVGPVVGLNNHEGSLITEDENRIGVVLEVANEKGIFFLDSRTTSQTRVPQVAMEEGFSYYQRDIFLDNSKSRADIILEIKKGVQIANKNGTAIMIGHVWSADVLPNVLREVYPELVKKGYRFTTVQKSGAQITP